MSAQHTPGPVGVDVDGFRGLTVGRATEENSAILRGIVRRTAERAAMRAALAEANAFTLTVERYLRGDLPADVAPASESEVAEAMYALRALIAQTTGGAA